MRAYHKINTIFKRSKETNKPIFDEWSRPEFNYLAKNEWIFTEKVDGTNIRVMFDGNCMGIGGRTDNAQIPTPLYNRLQEIFSPIEDDIGNIFGVPVCFYGEGYGGKIQKGSKYKETQDFVLFDVLVNDEVFLSRSACEEVCSRLGIDIVPVIGLGSLYDGIDIVKPGFKSAWGDFIAEGIIAKPEVEMRNNRGDRIITKSQ